MKPIKSPWSRQSRGLESAAYDPDESLLWYGMCTYFTEDWSTLSRTPSIEGRPGIPCCPRCGCVGFQAPASGYWAAVMKHDETHPGYLQIVRDNTEYCNAGGLPDFETLWIQKYHPESYRGNRGGG